MTQIATVEKILPGGFVEISVPRKSACGHDCEECAGCGMTGAAIHARAKDPVGVRPGQKVVVESATRKILGVVALVYLLPVVGFLLGTNIGEVITVFAAMLLWHKTPLLSMQLLWINLVTDSLPAISLRWPSCPAWPMTATPKRRRP